MNDPLSKTVEVICKDAKTSGLQVFYGFLPDQSKVPTVHWDSEHGGDWKQFVACAKAFDARVLYVNWAPFEQFDIDDAVSVVESNSEGGDEDRELTKQIDQLRAFQPKVGLTCLIDLAFCASGVIHTHQETADWFDEFSNLVPDEEDENANESEKISESDLRRWATALASDSRYCTSSRRDSLLKDIAGAEFSRLPAYKILDEAEEIFQRDYKQVAEEKLANDIQELRNQGLNLKAIGLKLGISQGRVSGIVSLMAPKRKSPV
jgi:hypothetical protein